MSGAPDFGPEEQERQVPQPVDEAVSLQGKILQQSHALCRGLAIVLEHHSCPAGMIEDMREQVCQYLSTSLDEREWFKMAKNLLTFPIAKYLKTAHLRSLGLESLFQREPSDVGGSSACFVLIPGIRIFGILGYSASAPPILYRRSLWSRHTRITLLV